MSFYWKTNIYLPVHNPVRKGGDNLSKAVNGQMHSDCTVRAVIASLPSLFRAQLHVIHFVSYEEKKQEPHNKVHRMSECISPRRP